MRTPHAFDFMTLKDREKLPDVVQKVAPFLKRHVYFPNRDEFDTWLLGLAQKEGAQVLHDSVVRPHDIEWEDGRYLVRAGGEVHTAKTLVGTNNVPLAFCARLTRANNRIMGEALGSIMAIIITHHMTNMRTA